MALIPPGYLKAVFSLGVDTPNGFRHIGTGFLYHHPIEETESTTKYVPFLVTNKHVVNEGVDHIRFNNQSTGQFEVHPIESVTKGDWLKHTREADVAVIEVLFDGPLIHGKKRFEGSLKTFMGDVGVPSREELDQISEGDHIYVIGFPLGLIGENWNYPIVRHGIIARFGDLTRENKDHFLIDSSIFPGNSGGPVILQPANVSVRGTKKITHALLIGVVSAYLPSKDVAVSKQTGNIRVVFEENSGLSEVFSFDIIRQIIDHAISSGEISVEQFVELKNK